MHVFLSPENYNIGRIQLKVMNSLKTSGLSSVREQIRQLNSDLQAIERRQASKPLDQDELLFELSTGKNSRPWAPDLQPTGHQLSQEALFNQLRAQSGKPITAVDLAATPVAGPLQHPEQPEELSQDSLLEALRTEAKRNV